MNWDDYEIFDPGVDRPLHELPRREARAAFKKLMREKERRVSELRKLTLANRIQLDAGDGLERLHDWFVASVEPKPDRYGRMANVWYSVVNDIALYLGERAIHESGGTLHWAFPTSSKTHASYQRAVLEGFPVPYPKYNVDLDLVIGMYGHRLVMGSPAKPDYFDELLRGVLKEASSA